jgi:peptide/nickel transport system permease protein
MAELILKRTLATLPMLLILSLFAFFLMRAVPGDPVDVLVGSAQRDLAPQELREIKGEFGLDQPLPKQYLSWVLGAFGGNNLGRSYKDGQPVAQVIAEKIPNTIFLVGVALVLTFVIGILWGIAMSLFAAKKSMQAIASFLSCLAIFFYSTPSFWLALLALFCVAEWFPGFPVLSLHAPAEPQKNTFVYVLLPALILALRRAAKVGLFLKASLDEEWSKPYVTQAFSKGLSRQEVLFRHVLKNSLLPVVSLIGLSLPWLFGGSVLIETIFAWPGMGRLSVEAAFGRNYPLLMALVMIYGVCVAAANLLSDLLITICDPRIKETNTSTSSHAI